MTNRSSIRPTRRAWLVLMTAAFMLVATASSRDAEAAADEPRKPNVIFILADDLGWTDLACYGSKYYETPNLDKLAADGMRFTNGYSCGPNCAPTRAALLTGQYGPRTGVYTVGSIDRFNWESRPLRPVDNVTKLPLDKVTLPQALKSAGYATAMFGKWHLGDNEQFHPSKRGFDEAIEASGKHFDFKTDPKTEYPQGQYLADFLTDRAIDFIGRNKDKPFFLYLPHFGVHAPYQAKPELIERFKNKPGVGAHNNPTYAAMLYSVDESVGRIMAELEKHKLANDTLVIFSSDNGGIGGYARAGVQAGKEPTDNAPLKGGKGMLYEGGVRVPYIFRQPGTIKPGTTSDTPICSVDLFPTLLALTGATPPPASQTLDGVNILPALAGKPVERDAIYWHFPGYLGAKGDSWRTTPVSVVRAGDYKLLEFFETGAVELYNLKDDPGQEHDLAKSEPARAKELHAKLTAWRSEVGAKMPSPNTEQNREGAKGKKKKRNKAEDNDE